MRRSRCAGCGRNVSDGKLPAHVITYLTLALCLFPDDDYREVATKVTGSLDRWGCWNAAWSVPTTSAITQARKRLGRHVFSELFERSCGPVAGKAGPTAAVVALGTARGSFLRRWRLLGIDGFDIDLPDSDENAAEFGYAGSGDNRSAFPKARVVALAECGTHAFVAAEVDAYAVGEKTLAQRLYPRLRGDELLTADRGFYSWQAWDTAAATGAGLLWRAPTQLDLPVVRVLPDGTYHTALIKPIIRGRRRERLLAAARAGADLTDINTVPDAFDERGLPVIHLARVIEYDVPDRDGNGTGELIVLLTNILDPAGDDGARADELAAGLPSAVGAGDRERPAENPPARPRAGAALAAARPGAPGDLGLPDRPPRDQRADRESVRRRRPRPGLDLLRPGPAPDPPHRHRDGGHSPLRTGLTGSRSTWPCSPPCSSPNGGNAPAPARSNAPDTTATGSRSETSPPASAIPARPTVTLRGLTPRTA